MVDRHKPILFRSADGRFSVSLQGDVVENMLRICKESRDAETGGILVGMYTDDRTTAIVEKVTGPPPDSVHLLSSFFRGILGLQELLNRMWAAPEKRYYLGEWHYHPLAIANPSGDDIAQMRRIAVSEKYSCPEPILVIVFQLSPHECRLSATVHPLDGVMVSLTESQGERG